METTNAQIAKLLRSVAAALTLNNGSFFQIRAYDSAADSIEHATSEIKDLWSEGRLGEVPGIGENIKKHLNELFTMGKVAHFEAVLGDFPPFLYELLEIPGIGPKTAQKITNLDIKSFIDLKKQIESGDLAKKGISMNLIGKLEIGLSEINSARKRMLLPYATALALKVLEYLKTSPDVKKVDSLGSLRRKVATIGDLDFAASSENPPKVTDFFTKFSGVKHVVNKGEDKATVLLDSGIQIDLLVGKPEAYGALLQHFTGSKHHNIKLRIIAEKRGYSLSEYGVKEIKTGKALPIEDESQIYSLLQMQTPDPEIREDSGEIEAAIKGELPELIKDGSIKGDLHIHSNYPIEPSHDLGADSMEEIVQKAISLGYQYIGISDHSPAQRNHNQDDVIRLIKVRTKYIEQLKYPKDKIRVLNGLEVDIMPNGTLSVPNPGLELLDYCIAGIHSSHGMNREDMTKRILNALENPYVKILAHPTGRLLNQRESFEVEWEKVFEYCARNNKVLEINSYPSRLDLPDSLARVAISRGVKLIINTDAHAVDQMELIPFGVSVARRGWAGKENIINSWDWKKIADWFTIKS